MTTQTRKNDSTAPLYLALELGSSKWKLLSAVRLGARPRTVSIAAGDLAALKAEIAKSKQRHALGESAPVLSCYEAGRDGFWLHRELLSEGIENVVVDPSSIAVDRRARRAKTDRLDGEKLLRHLIRFQEDPQEWRVVRVPSVEDEDERHLHRELTRLKRERTQHTNLIQSLLVLHGLRLAVRSSFLEDLAQLSIPSRLRARLIRQYQRRQLVEDQIRELEKERRDLIASGETVTARQAAHLSKLCGIGETSAWVFASELFSWRELRNRRQVASLLGLAPTPYNSDQGEREQGINKAGLRDVRALAVEISWCWLRYQPQSQLSLWYHQRFGSGRRSRKVGIVALARKLMIALWRYTEFGIVPEGATLKV